MEVFFIFLLSYIVGSIPFGLIITKLFGYGDLRNFGSGNIGATNVLRTGNKKIAFLVLLLDFLKCYLPILIISIYYNLEIAGFCALLSIIGHIFPVWLKFRGGKGVACFFAFLLAINPVFFIISVIIWITVAIISKYSSLGSIISVISSLFLFLIYEHHINIVIPLTIIILIIFKHKDNIERLIKNKESKINIK
tara:strand:+ start:215 stop:796 length:582 start_codon:yes stop_codon:yes gene_type:complete